MSNETRDKGFWTSLVDGLVGALSGALIAAATKLLTDNQALQEKLKEAQDVLEKTREVERKRRDAAERERVRKYWGADGPES